MRALEEAAGLRSYIVYELGSTVVALSCEPRVCDLQVASSMTKSDIAKNDHSMSGPFHLPNSQHLSRCKISLSYAASAVLADIATCCVA